MFKKIFDFFFHQQKSNAPLRRDLFDELFPLTAKDQQVIEETTRTILLQMLEEEGLRKFQKDIRSYPSQLQSKGSLEFESFGWELDEETNEHMRFYSEYGDVLLIDIVNPNGPISKEQNELGVYRNWLRDTFARQGGGMIFCEDGINQNGVEGYESLLKMPRDNTTGVDYIYFLNMRNYKEQKLYQVHLKLFEGSPTGMRDNLMMHGFSKVSNLDLGALMNYYRKDPYDGSYTEGNTMNLSEREEFDYLFPNHPLSVIRLKMRKRLFDSLRFKIQ